MTIWKPMLATSASVLPVGPEWTYEVKWDGYRVIAIKDGARVRLLSRNQKDLTRDYPSVTAAIGALKPASVVLDGEVVAIDSQGRPSFQALQHRATSDLAVVYCAFDLLQAGGDPLVGLPLHLRRRRLAAVVKNSAVWLSEPLPGTTREIEQAVRGIGLEGVVAKRRDSLYRPGQRSEEWLKVKFSPRQDFVVGGFKPTDRSFDSILVGYYGNGGELRFAAKVRAGFTPHARAEIAARLARIPRRRCPFANLPNSAGRSRWGEGITEADMAKLRWVAPTVVVEVSFVEWTRDGLLRHPRFLGVRTDVHPRSVRREAVAAGPEIV